MCVEGLELWYQRLTVVHPVAYSDFMEARATAKAWFKIERETAYALAVVAVCLLAVVVVATWTISKSRGQQQGRLDVT